MKMLVAIVQDMDSERLVDALMDKGFRVTKLATTGGFLRAGNSTLISGVENEKVDEALEIIRQTCKSREEMVAASPFLENGMYTPYPVKVTVGGATVFVMDVEQFVKI